MFAQTFFLISIAIVGLMTLAYGISLLMRNNTTADYAWSIGFMMTALISLFLHENYYPRQLFITSLIMLWGLRLLGYLIIRNKGKGEDSRYQRYREKWGRTFHISSFFRIFMFQSLLLLSIAYPIIIINTSSSRSWTYIDVFGIVVWSIGFFFEMIGDIQLFLFKRDPRNKGKLMTKGLWKYTRHPNYFGESMMWWGIFFVCLSVRNGYLGILSPIIITYLLLKVSGIPLTEERLKDRPGFKKYKEETSGFVPLPPKKSA